MRHGMQGRKFSRSSSNRKAMFASLATALFTHGQIKTTLAKAKDLRRVADRLITKAKKGDLAARREVLKVINDKAVVHKLFTEIAENSANRPGGYTRVLKAGFRKGDCAPMAVIALTDYTPVAAPAQEAAEEAKTEA